MSGIARRACGARRRPSTLALALTLLISTGIAEARRPFRPAPPATPRVEDPPQAPVQPASESPEDRLARGRQAYLRNDFEGTVRAVEDLLYPEVQLRSDDDVQNAHRLLALAWLLLRDEAKAEAEFSSLLQLNPNFTLDPVSDPPSAIAFLDRLKKRESERVEVIERRKREEAERARLDDERRREEAEAKRLREMEERIRRSLKPVLFEKHSAALAFVPFGAGQFQNGQRTKAWAFFGTQAGFAAVSLATWAALAGKYDLGQKPVPKTEWATAQILQGFAIGAGALFFADVAWGIVDALVYYRPEVRVPTPDGAAPSGPRTSLAPVIMRDGGGLSLGGTF